MKAEERIRRIVNTYGYQKDKPILKKDLELLKKKIKDDYIEALKEKVEDIPVKKIMLPNINAEKYEEPEREIDFIPKKIVLNLITNLEDNG